MRTKPSGYAVIGSQMFSPLVPSRVQAVRVAAVAKDTCVWAEIVGNMAADEYYNQQHSDIVLAQDRKLCSLPLLFILFILRLQSYAAVWALERVFQDGTLGIVLVLPRPCEFRHCR